MWGKALSSFEQSAIDGAFENWLRNGKFFPRPAEIVELATAYTIEKVKNFQFCGSCYNGWIITNPEVKICDYKVKRCHCVGGEK